MRIAVCDDETQVGMELVRRIKADCVDIEVECFANTASLLDYLNKYEADAVFLDIELGNENGIEAAEKIAVAFPEIRIVFVTAYSAKYCEAVFLQNVKLRPFGFIDKSSDNSVLKRTLVNIRQSVAEKKALTSITLHINRTDHIVDANKIVYVESKGRNAELHLSDNTLIVATAKLTELLELLPSCFCLIHKSFLINALTVREYNYTSVTLNGGVTLPVSRTQRDSFKTCLLKARGIR